MLCTRVNSFHIYGSGLRLMKAARLRVKDVDFDYGQLIIRAGKGDKDLNTTMVYTHILQKGSRGARSPLNE
jgi:integrase